MHLDSCRRLNTNNGTSSLLECLTSYYAVVKHNNNTMLKTRAFTDHRLGYRLG